MTPTPSHRDLVEAHAASSFESPSAEASASQAPATDGPMMFDAAAMIGEARRMHQAMLAAWAMDVLTLRRRRALQPRWFAGERDERGGEWQRLAA